ncbi:MAG: shikimate kinase [Chloroflexi bacterium]|nr:shikimate kinase [Chloroflexota bacterium]
MTIRKRTPPLPLWERGPGGEGAQPFKHVVLVGLSGTGKSTAGRLLAARLGRTFLDTDDLIVERAGRSIPEIFARDGEPAFRALEREAVRLAVDGPPAVIATGGGAPVNEANRRALWDGSFVVWLHASVDTLVGRLGQSGHGRPLLAAAGPAARLSELLAQREPIYATAHARLDADTLTAAEIVEHIVAMLESRD